MTVWVRQLSLCKKYQANTLLGFLALVASLALSLMSVSPLAQAQSNPSTDKTISFSARLRSSSGAISPDGKYNIRFNLYSSSTGGEPVWTETYYDTNGPSAGQDHRVEVKNGYLNVRLGSRTAFGSSVNWNDNLWLTMNVGGQVQEGSTANIPWDGEMTPRIQLGAVPYAISAGSLGGLTSDQFIQLGQGAQTNSSNNPSIHINTTGEGNLIQLQRDAEDVFTIDNTGNIVFGSKASRIISVARSEASTDGQSLTITAGSGGEGTSNGGNLVLSGGEGSGGGANGLVVLTTATFATATNDSNCYSGGALVSSSCVVSQPTVDNSSAAIIGFSQADQTATLPDPTLSTPGRVFYVMAADDSLPFTLMLNGNDSISMQPKSARTLLWNGSDWVRADSGGEQPEMVIDNNNPVEGLQVENNTLPELEINPDSTSPEPSTTADEEELETSQPETDPSVIQLGTGDQAPEGDISLGAMYYDTTLGKIQCFEADGWGPCVDAPDTFVTISPEYKNAVMNGTDIGIISSDFCSGTLGINDGSDSQPVVCGPNETYNFYSWTSPEDEDQTRSIYLTYQLPDNFKEFVPSSTSIMGRTSSDEASVAYQIYRDNGSGLEACGSSVGVSSGAGSSWQRGSAAEGSDPSGCNFEPGDSILFRINLTAKNEAIAYVSNVHFIFRNN